MEILQDYKVTLHSQIVSIYKKVRRLATNMPLTSFNFMVIYASTSRRIYERPDIAIRLPQSQTSLNSLRATEMLKRTFIMPA